MTTPTSDAMIRRAVIEKVTSIMESSDVWDSPVYTVYSMDAQDNTTQEPARPFVFVGTSRSGSIPRWLPVIVCETMISRVNYELGSMGSLATISINIIPRHENELSAISEAIKSNFLELDAGDGYSRPIEEEWSERPVPVPYDPAMEGSLRFWTILENSIIFTGAIVPTPD